MWHDWDSSLLQLSCQNVRLGDHALQCDSVEHHWTHSLAPDIYWTRGCLVRMSLKLGSSALAGHIAHWIETGSVRSQGATCTDVTRYSKLHPRRGHEGTRRQQLYIANHSLTSQLDGVGGQRHALTVLPAGKTGYPLYRRLGGPKGRSRQVRKIFPPPASIPGPSSPWESLHWLSYPGPYCHHMKASEVR
jgi:hypothetical protein